MHAGPAHSFLVSAAINTLSPRTKRVVMLQRRAGLVPTVCADEWCVSVAPGVLCRETDRGAAYSRPRHRTMVTGTRNHADFDPSSTSSSWTFMGTGSA